MKFTYIILSALFFAPVLPLTAMEEASWSCEFLSFVAQLAKEAAISVSFKCHRNPEVDHLFETIRTNNVTELATVLAGHPELIDRARDENGMDPVLAAAIRGDAGIMAVILQHTSTVNKAAQPVFALLPSPVNKKPTWQSLPQGFTPLMAAAVWNHPNIAKQLISANAKKDMVDTTGKNALAYAKNVGDINMINLLTY